MNFITTIQDFLSGKKTYIIAISIILLVAMEKLLQIDIPGFEAGENWLDFVLAALGLSTLRAGMTKAPEAK